MARSDAVWGIDIGQCALKALRCRPGGEEGQVLADAFDYVEYPKILSQPEADPVALVQEAITQFLSRNSVRGDRVAVSVPGQNGLARFIKLPPVESKKIPDIVKYEAKQQIPFSLDDVVWDYQKMVGGSEEEGFSLETEVGLFAMKRDQVYRALRPFTEAGIEVDFVQLTPLALYNYVAFDQMQDLPPPADYDPDSPPPSVVLLSLGTDSTDLVVTNGFRVWQRSVPIGGNHFTKALTKELKLTFATAEHLKRNAAKAEDPKALFQAMRPVFNDLLTEVQRSIGYFSNLDRRAKIGRVLALGNAMKLPGLQRYFAQNMGFEFQRVESFRSLVGASVVDAPAFKENVLSFGVCYGLALQGLKEAKIRTNLLPRELMKDRMIRAKKPWAVGAAATLLMGCTISYFGYWRAWNSVLLKNYFENAVSAADGVVSTANRYDKEFGDAKTAYKKTADVGQSLVVPEDRRERWLLLWKGLNLCLPHDEGPPPRDITKRNVLNIMSVQAQRVEDLASWYTGVQEFNKPEPAPAAAPAAESAEGTPDPNETAAATLDSTTADAGPTGTGWVIELRGYHFHNAAKNPTDSAQQYVQKTLIKNLKGGKVSIPEKDRQDGGPTEIDLKKLGIAFPVVLPGGFPSNKVFRASLNYDNKIAGPDVADEAPNERGEARGPLGKGEGIDAPRFDFIVQLCWTDEPPKEEAPAEVGDQPASEQAPATPTPVPTTVAESAATPESAEPAATEAATATPSEPPAADQPPPAGDSPATAEPAATEPAASTPPAETVPSETPAAAPETPANP